MKVLYIFLLLFIVVACRHDSFVHPVPHNPYVQYMDKNDPYIEIDQYDPLSSNGMYALRSGRPFVIQSNYLRLLLQEVHPEAEIRLRDKNYAVLSHEWIENEFNPSFIDDLPQTYSGFFDCEDFSDLYKVKITIEHAHHRILFDAYNIAPAVGVIMHTNDKPKPPHALIIALVYIPKTKDEKEKLGFVLIEPQTGDTEVPENFNNFSKQVFDITF